MRCGRVRRPPCLQVEIAIDGFKDRVDFGWPAVRALGESDGYQQVSRRNRRRHCAAGDRREAQRGSSPKRMSSIWPLGLGSCCQHQRPERPSRQHGRAARPPGSPALLATLRANPRSLVTPKIPNPPTHHAPARDVSAGHAVSRAIAQRVCERRQRRRGTHSASRGERAARETARVSRSACLRTSRPVALAGDGP